MTRNHASATAQPSTTSAAHIDGAASPPKSEPQGHPPAAEVRAGEAARELESLLRLTLTSGLGPVRIRRLLEHFRTARAAAASSSSALCAIEGIGPETASRLVRAMREVDVQAEFERAHEHGVAMLPITSPAYPPLLRLIPDAPPILYVRGTMPASDVYTVALVGSRNCTAYGRDIAARLASGLAQMGLTIVSGGARGVDTAAHRGALQVRGRTVVVLGSGLCHAYPRENQPLFESVVENGGAVVSEFPLDTRPAAENFPRRNRIISGLSLGTLVVEAPRRSGALITARQANEEHGRVVMALPGRADSSASEGCHELIRDGAALVTNTRQILSALDSASHLVAAARDAARSPLVADATPTLFEMSSASASASDSASASPAESRERAPVQTERGENASGPGRRSERGHDAASADAVSSDEGTGQIAGERYSSDPASLRLVDVLRQREQAAGSVEVEMPGDLQDAITHHGGPAQPDVGDRSAGGRRPRKGGTPKQATAEGPKFANLTPSQRKILEALATDSVEVGDLAMQTGLPISQLQADLTILQIRGLIARVAAGNVRREP
ncbi:MAG: DNA-processing protein DprA [Planctomycetota bacterium]